ncbi:zinc finger protein 91-like [Toxorhynchites rutilus septentrionalis]|uniref:zinc finger protein 91-like n=1 Tax=Toxorhynchites rutilus septentrionalis TaxID=329112 RepID=UPI00247A8083|nr:zinc finger protein 91-like [Toxorhynchites rutilus septentrionalis]XP_055631063.1 zinc finger protein 91-like [Toxorhynchites rutilus septentrionalis]
MTGNLQDCLTCRRQTESYLRITDESNVENVEAILVKHFWFKPIEYVSRVLCISCWEKIEEFHKFYCEVEELCAENVQHVVVKTEPQEGLPISRSVKAEEHLTEKTDIHIESDVESEICDETKDTSGEDNDDHDGEMKQEEYSEDDSIEESSTPIAKRRRYTGRTTSNNTGLGRKKQRTNYHNRLSFDRNNLIAKYIRLACEICNYKAVTFSRLLLHYKRMHDRQGYVTCCERSFQKKSTLCEHLRKHESDPPDLEEDTPFRCEQCDCSKTFKDEEGLQLHRVICHSMEGEKIFKCDQCDKAFASEWQLSGHKNWHQNVESLNIHCDKCNKYFNSIRTLNTHVRAHHLDVAAVLPLSTEAVIPADVNMESTSHKAIVPHTEQCLTKYTTSHNDSNISSVPRKALKSAEEVAKEDELIRQFCTLICEKCEFVGENYYQLEKHYKTDHNTRGYAVCCGRKFCKKRRLFEHCQRHINPDMFRCELCNKSFTESDGLEKHNKWVHTPDSEKPFKCEICDAAFYKDYLLRNHMKYHISMEQKIFNCKDCDKSFGTAVLLRAHQQNIHGAASNWVCDICAKGFVHKSLLETHRLSHSEEGAASLKKQCEHCKKWLKNKDTYQNHLKRCLAGGPVTCDICGKEAVNELALASHKRFNHEDRPAFACSYCGKQFKRILRLKEHEANHRGEVLYSCPYCPRTCNSSSNMYTHKKVAHPELWAAKVAERFYKR